MALAVGTVKSTIGYVVARLDGEERVLSAGDVINKGDVVVTSPGSNIVITLNNGDEIQLDGGQTLAMDDSVLGDVELSDAEAEAQAIQDALAQGENIEELEQDTATGDNPQENLTTYNFLPGDSSQGNVGSYLLGSSGGSGEEGDDFGGAPDNGNNNGQTPAASQTGGSTGETGGEGSGDSGSTAPQAVVDNVSVDEDSSVVIDLLANDVNATGITSINQPSNGTVTLNEDGTVTYTPDANFNGTDGFSYVISDADGNTSTAVVNVSVNPVNDGPLAEADGAELAEDSSVTISVLANDTDIDGDELEVVSVTQPENGTVVVNADGTVTYTPVANFNGTDSFTYTISDGNGGTDTATVNLTVTPENDNPVAVNDIQSVDEDGSVNINVLANDSDLDGDTVSVESADALSANGGTVVVNADGTITYTPAANFNGTDTFQYTITDGNGGTDTATVTVNVAAVNDGPVAEADGIGTNEDEPVTISVLDNDTDLDGDTLTIESADALSANGGTVVVNADGTITYTPAANFNGTDTFQYTITDGNGGTDTATVTVNVAAVNDGPVANDDSKELAEDSAAVINVIGNDTDIEGDELSVTSVTQPEHGVVTINGDGTVTYTPVANFNGTDSFTYTISDGNGGTDTATVNLTVTPENDNPVAVDDIQSVDEDGSVNINVLANDSDLDGDTVSVESADEFSANGGTVVVNPDGTITYTPAANFNGTDTFQYTITDGNGGTDTATVTVNVAAVNDGPVANDDSKELAEDSAAVINVIGNDTDIEGDELSVTSVTQPEHGVVTINGDGTVTYTPVANFNGTDSFTYTISDGNGGTDTATVNLTVTPENDNPVAIDDIQSVDEDGSVKINVLANDSDLDGDTLTIESADALSANGGTVVVNADGTITYTPAANFNGTDTFQYTITDGNGGTDTATVTVNVAAVNDGPVAEADGIGTNEDEPVTISVLDNDTDLDGDTLTIESADALSANGGTVVVNPDGTITYTPAANFNGTDTFQYTITDGNGGTDTATVTVNVAAVNDGPVANDDSKELAEDSAAVINVIGNDTDIEGDELSVTSVTQPEHGVVTINGDGTVTYTPVANFNGTDSFTYTISDGNGGTDTATVNLTVTPENDNPVAIDDIQSVDEDGSVNINVLANDSDLDGDTVSVESADEFSANGGTVVVNADGTITYTPAANFNGTDTFQYTITDGNGGTDTATVTVNVAAVNDGPETSDKSVTVDASGEVTFDLSDFDEGGAKDLEDDASADKTTSVVIDSLPEHGTLYYVESDGSLTEITEAGVTVDDVTNLTYKLDEGYNSTIVMGTQESSGVVGQWGEVENGVLTYKGANGITATITATDDDGNSAEVGFNNLINRQDGLGIGVVGGADNDQIDTGESLTVSFDAPVSNVVIGLGGLGENFDSDNPRDAEAHWVAYDADGDIVAEGFVQRGDNFTAEVDLDGVTFNSIQFFNVSTGGNSNFVLQYIEYTNADMTDSFDYHAVDSDDAISNTSTVTFDIEQGAVAEYNVAPEAESDTISLNSDGGYAADFTLDPLTSDYEDDNDGDPATSTTVTIESLPEHGTLYYGGEEVHIGQEIPDAAQLQYVLDGDAETVSVLMGSKGDGTIDNWGTVTTDESGKTVIEFEAGDVTATISSPNGDIGFNDYSGINKQDGFGLGVDGGVDDNQIDLGETLVIDFDSPVSNATVGLAGLGENFGGSIDAYAHWEAFDAEGNLIASGDVQNDGDEVNSFTIDTDGISQIVFSVTNTTVNSNFTVQYIELNAVTSDSFDYSVTDSGGKGSETATITFDIEPSDTLTAEHAPVALDDSAELKENTSIEIDVLANDSDIDGDDLTVSIHTDPEHGTVQIVDGKVVYTPDADYEGADTFTYTVTDTDGKTDTATVSLNVLHENEAPVITVENTETTVTYVSEEASYNNVIGLYTVNEAGEPVLVSILEDNGNYGAGNFQIDPADGDFGTYTGDGSDLHFFIIANGNVGDVDYDSIRFVDNGDGYTAQYSNGENMVNINRPVYFDNAELNPGNVEHFQTTVNADGSITIGVEDLAPATSDEDYDDAVMRLETGNVTFVEDGEAVSIAGDVTIADDDSSTMTNMTVTLTNPLASDVMSILGDLPEGITADTSVPYQITFTNTAADPASVSIADFETALKMVTFENTSQDPDETPREFTVSVTDDTGLTSNVADFTVNVESVNDAPVAGDDSYSTTEDIEGGITFDALVNDSDVEGDVSISTFEQPANGTVVLNADGTFTYTPDADFNGTDTFTYQVTDADGALSEPATVTIVVDPVNDAPVVTVNDVETSVTFNSINTGASYTNAFGVYFTDADGNPVSGEILAGDSKGDINFDLGTYDTAASNVHFFLISNIGAGGYEEGEVTFEMVNGKPVMSIDGVEVTKNVFYSDNDLNKDGKDHFAVTENADGSVTIAIEDLYGKDATNDTDFRVDVTETDQAAVFTEDGGAIHIVQDVTVTDVDDTTMFELKVTLENYQPGEDVLSIDENMLPDGIEYDITDGVITFTNSGEEMSNEDFAQAVESIMYNNTSDTPDTADREFRVEVSDGEAWSNAANITVEVVPVNDAPLAVDDVNTISDVSDTSSLNIVIALDTSGSMFHDRYNDIKGDETRLQIALDSLKEMLGSYEPSEVGGVMLVEFFGDVSTNTGQNGVWLTYDEAMDLITNFEIPFDQNNLNTDYDSALQMIMDNYESSTADGSMPAADETVMYFLSDGSPQGSDYEDGRSNSNSISSSEAGVWNEFAGANFSNVYAVGIGVNAASSQLSLVAGENGQVLLVNDEHGLAETLVNIADTSKVIGNVLLNDTDPEDIDWSDSSNGTNVQLTVTGAEAGGETSDSVALDNMSDGSITVQGEYGTLTINSDGSYVYTLDTENPAVQAMGDGESALDKFSYTVADSEGATDIATLSITVNGINDAPVAADDYGTVTAAGAEAVDVTATVELTNETTAGGANSDIDLTGVVVTDLGDLSLNFNINGGAERNFYMVGSTEGGNNINAGDGNDIFLLNGPINGNTAIAGGSGHDILILGGSQSDYTFQNYTNNNGMINTQIIDKGTGQMITVNEIEEIRFGGYSEGSTEYDVVITTDPAGAEVDSFTITVTNATLSAGTDNGDGTWTVSADEVEGLKAVSTGGTVSVGEITFELADGYTGVDAGSDESVILTGDVLANDSDPDGDSLSVTDVDGSDVDGDTVIEGEYGTLTINSDGTYTYELDSENTDVKGLSDGQTLTETFTYTISDGKESSSADLNITINGANEAPVVTDAYVSGDEDTAIRIDVSGDFSDAEGPASITEFTQGANGSVVQNSDGTFSYTPADDFSGEDSFTYTVTDADGATSTATVNVTVNPVADAPSVSLSISEAVTESTANLIVNGSFEDVTGIKPNGGYSSSSNINSGSYKAMTSIPGWELVGEASETSNTMEIHNAGHMSVGSTDGTNYMDLGETNSSNDGDRDNTHIGQVLSGLEEGESYTLTFDYVDKAAIANNPASGAMQVIWGGEVIATITGDNTTWESYTVEVIGGAGNGNDRLEFKEIGTAYDNHGMAIDNVQLVATPDSVEFTLTLDAAVTDLNGAVSYESLESLTLSGLPEGAELSIGTDNGDGTWTISVENLTTYHGEVTMTVPAGTADFDLTLSAAAVESGNGDVSELAEAVVHVDVPGEAVVANEAPFIDLNGPEGLDFSEETVDYSTTYTMGSDQGVAIAAADLYIQDMDDTTLTSMTIAITGNFDALDTLNIDETALGGGLKVTYSEDGTSMTIASEDGSAVGIEHFENALGSVTFSTESDSLDARDISVTVADGADSTITTTAHTSVSIDVPAQEYTPEIHSLDGNFDAFGHRGGNYGNSNEYAPTGNNAEAINEDGFYAVRSVNESNNNSEDFDIETSESISFHIHDDVTSATFEFYNADSDATDSGVGSTTWLIYDANGDAIDPSHASVTFDGTTATFTSDVPFQYIVFDAGNNGNGHSNNDPAIDPDGTGDVNFIVKPVEYQAADTYDMAESTLDTGSIDFSNVESYGHIDLINMSDDDAAQIINTLNVDDVLGLTDEDRILTITGGEGDQVQMSNDWSYDNQTGTFTANDGSGAEVHIQGSFDFDPASKIITFDDNNSNDGCQG